MRLTQGKVVQWGGGQAVIKTQDGKLVTVNTNRIRYPGANAEVFAIKTRRGFVLVGGSR